MGSSNSATDNRRQVRGGIYIQIPKTFYVSNEYITGTVYINLEEQYRGHILMIGLEGLEETHFTYTSGSGEDQSTVYAEGKNKFLDYKQPIYDFANNYGSSVFILNPGQWQIPFQLRVADKLPSTLKYFSTQYNQCFIKYYLRAFVIPNDATCRPLEGQQEIMIGQQLIQQNTPINNMINQEITCCCCCSKGTIKISGSLNNSFYSPNEVIKLKFDCDASGYDSNVETLNIKLQGVLTMTSQHKVKEVVRLNVSEQTIQMNTKKLSSTIDIHIPPTVQLSSTSSLIDLQNQILITPKADGCCMRRSYEYFLNFHINPNPQTFQNLPLPLNQVQAPQNWNPIQLQQQQYSEQQNLHLQQIQLQYQNQIQYQDQQNQNAKFIQNQQPIMGRPL